MIKTNEIKKGTLVRLSNGWQAEMFCNKKGTTRMVKEVGDYVEIGSIYSHDILQAKIGDHWEEVEHTPTQIKLKNQLSVWGM